MEEVSKRKRKIRTAVIRLYKLFAFIIIILFVIPWFALTLLLNQRYEQPQFDSLDFGIESERITLTTNDGLNLAAWRTYAEGSKLSGTVIIVSGIQQPSVTAFFGYSQMFAENGWDTLLIEKRARSASEGKSIGLAMTEWMDVLAGVDFLEIDERAGDFPIIALGTSAGGAAVIVAAAEVPRIDGVIAISAYTNFIDAYVDNAPYSGIPRFIANATRPFMWLNLGFRFGFNELNRAPINAIEKLDERPILLMHSTEDWEVPFIHFERLKQAALDVGAHLSTFEREGNWHFVVYDISTPAEDVEFSGAIFEFLAQFE